MTTHVITYATHSYGNFEELVNNKYGIKVIVLGWGKKWKGFTDKFNAVYKYSKNFGLNLNFIVEDNGLSTNTPTHIAWNKRKGFDYKKYHDVIYYKYKNK